MPRVTTSFARAFRLMGTSLGFVAGAATLTVASEARAASPYLEIPDPAVAMQSPAYRYANMSDADAYAELDKRGILYSRVASAVGVRAPIRLTGRLHGVLIRSALPPEERAISMFEICDARLALALDDFAAILQRHDVDEVVHFTMYRPNVPNPADAHVAADAPGTVGSNASATDSHHTSRPSKRRAFLDEKGTKGSKAHSASSHASESRRKDGPLDGADPSFGGAPALSVDAPVMFGQGATSDLAPSSELGAKTPATKDKASAAPSQTAPVKKWGHGAGSTRPLPSKGGNLKPGVNKLGAKGGFAKSADAQSFGDEAPHGTWAPPGTRHPAGLAIDVGILKKKSGKVLSIASSFQGKLGDRTCGAGAPVPESEDARELRSIVCEAHDAGVFTYTLTPNYNVAHRDHFHMEIKPGVVWFLYN